MKCSRLDEEMSAPNKEPKRHSGKDGCKEEGTRSASPMAEENGERTRGEAHRKASSDDVTTQECIVREKSGGDEEYQIMIVTLSGRIMMMNVKNNENVESVKKRVREKEGFTGWLNIMKDGKILNDTETMKSHRIIRGDCVRVTSGLLGGMKKQNHQGRNARKTKAGSHRAEGSEKVDNEIKDKQKAKGRSEEKGEGKTN